MKKYKIEVDMTLTAYVEVEAENEDQAREMAWDEVQDKKVSLCKDWQSDVNIKSEEYVWKVDDYKKLYKVFGKDDWCDLDDEEINNAIDDFIIFVANDRQGAYEAFCNDGFAELDELRANGIDPTFEWFCSELDKGYHESGSIEIARLVETSNGIFYDKEYC